MPERSDVTGLLDLGIGPSISTKLLDISSPSQREAWDRVSAIYGLSGVEPGMTLVSVNAAKASSPLALGAAARASPRPNQVR